MKEPRVIFATDDYEKRRAPARVWVPRTLITGLMAGTAAVLCAMGYFHF